MVNRDTLVTTCNQLLSPEKFKDYAPNGLQLEGKDHIERIVTGVTASMALIDAAIDAEADALIVHHGWFWPNENPTITAAKYRRIQAMIKHGINLLAYHLPLDAHPEFGNNAMLAQRWGFNINGVMDEQGVGNVGTLSNAISLDALQQRISEDLGRPALAISAGDHFVERVAWCSGGAQNWINDAISLGADCYISGEISEHTTHTARENGIHYIAAGHHATERYGAKALGERLAADLGITSTFIDIDNPA